MKSSTKPRSKSIVLASERSDSVKSTATKFDENLNRLVRLYYTSNSDKNVFNELLLHIGHLKNFFYTNFKEIEVSPYYDYYLKTAIHWNSFLTFHGYGIVFRKFPNPTNRKVLTEPKVTQGLRDLFEDELKDIYWAEKALTKAIPKMAKNATSEELVNALSDHLEVTKGHVQRLEETFKILGKAARAKKCEAMAGLLKEVEEIMEDTEEGVVRDAAIISAGQKVEHYEIATYGTLCAFAKTLGEEEIASLLQQTLDEEKEADQKLTEIAEASITVDIEKESEEPFNR